MKKVLILTAIMAFAMMLGFGVQSASADSVLFPYFTSGGARPYLLWQIINTKVGRSIIQGVINSAASTETLHIPTVYKHTRRLCLYYDDNGDTSRERTYSSL